MGAGGDRRSHRSRGVRDAERPAGTASTGPCRAATVEPDRQRAATAPTGKVESGCRSRGRAGLATRRNPAAEGWCFWPLCRAPTTPPPSGGGVVAGRLCTADDPATSRTPGRRVGIPDIRLGVACCPGRLLDFRQNPIEGDGVARPRGIPGHPYAWSLRVRKRDCNRADRARPSPSHSRSAMS